MGDNFPNLIDTIQKYIPGEFVGKMSSLLGESREKTQLGVQAGVPSLLGGLGDAASTTDGARRVSTAVDDADEGILGNIGRMFGKSSVSSLAQGTTMLRPLLGGGALSQLTGNIGRLSGLSGSSVTSMLGVLAPIVFGVLKREKTSRGLDSSGLASLLAGQRGNIASAISGIEKREETYTAPHRVETYAAEKAEPVHHSASWVLPLALLAGLGALIWYFASRPGPAVHAAREERTTAVPAPRTTPTASFQELKNKYQPVIDRARSEGVQISSLTEEGGKLVIKGTAPSQEAANQVWDEIKKINPNPSDLVADFPVNSSSASAAPGAVPSATPATPTSPVPGNQSAEEYGTKPMEPNVPSAEKPTAPATEPSTASEAAKVPSGENNTYTVRSGDTLSSIAKRFYGNSSDFKRIFNANRDLISNANQIQVGQELNIPGK